MFSKKLFMQGRAAEPYEIEIKVENDTDKINISCSCPGGIFKKNCKHILGVLSLDENYIGDLDTNELIKLKPIFEKDVFVIELSDINRKLLMLEKEVKDLKAKKLQLLKNF